MNTPTQALISRLDSCLSRVDSTEIKSQGLVYAAFLSDLEKNLINARDPNTQAALSVIGEFCDLVDQEFPDDTTAATLS